MWTAQLATPWCKDPLGILGVWWISHRFQGTCRRQGEFVWKFRETPILSTGSHENCHWGPILRAKAADVGRLQQLENLGRLAWSAVGHVCFTMWMTSDQQLLAGPFPVLEIEKLSKPTNGAMFSGLEWHQNQHAGSCCGAGRVWCQLQLKWKSWNHETGKCGQMIRSYTL